MTQVGVFQQFEIRPEARQLLVGGEPVGIGARAFDVLLALTERAERVVSKAELLDLAWPGVVVEENNLTVQISALRRVLGHETIVTVTGRGYRLKATPVDKPAPEQPTPDRHDDTAPRLQRRLAVIVQAEVVGWPRLVSRDPTRAATTWKRIRVDLIERSLPQFGGRAIELTAERLQLEFGSAVEAVAWAVELQEALAERRQAADPAENPAFHVRIGIAVDDVIVDDGKLVGDGVNVAADLQLSAVHDEILTTQKVCDFVIHKIAVGFEPLGQRVMQKSQRPVHVLRVAAGSRHHVAPALRPAGVRVASLAVLPFATEGPPADAYFGEGVTEEIIATLSLNRALFVIAHSSTLRYRGSEPEPTAAAAELGVRYLVTGRVRRVGSHVRIHVSLIHAADQRVLWQQPFDGLIEELFASQAEIAAKVAASVAPQVQDEEIAQARHRPTDSFDAYDCVLRALVGMAKLGTAEFESAGQLLLRAVSLDPGYAQAHAHLAWWYSLRQFDSLSSADGREGRLALEHSLESVRLDSRDAWALSVAGYMLSLQKQHDEALDLFEKALALNPSCAAAWARSAATLCYVGRAEESLERLDRAMRLSPFDQHLFWHLTVCGGASFVARRYDESAGWLGKALRLAPGFNAARRLQIAALARTGEVAEARALAEQFLADCPGFSVQEFGRWSPMLRPHLDDLLSALRLAGLPD